MKLYELEIDGLETEVYFNSIVNIPAHLKTALKFKQDEAPKRFAFNEEKQIMSGVMVAVDEPIYRYNPETKEEFNVVFRKSVADKIIRDYMSKGYANNLNLDHNEREVFQSAYLLEMYQIDAARGNSVPVAFEGQNLQDGSIIVSYHIPDHKEWEIAKTKGGFSVEGVFELIEVNNQNQEKMSLLEKLGFATKQSETKNKKTFSKAAQAFAEATLEDGTEIYWDGELNEGTAIFVDVDGVMTPAPDGVHVTTEGLVIETVEGIAVSISMPEEAEEEVEEEAQEFATVNEVAAAFEAFEAKLMDAFKSELTAVKEDFTNQLNAKNEDFKALQSDFMKVKKAAPAAAKQKFEAPKAKPSAKPAIDLLDFARVKK
jgi:hypothetical protein